MQDFEIIYRNSYVMKLVYAISERERNIVTDTQRLEDLILRRINRYVKGVPERLNHTRVINRLAHQVAAQVKSDYKRERYELFDEFSAENREGEEIEYEPEDVLADVESDVIAKEMTALLAQDDHRKLVILERWAIGNTNDWQVANALARILGGNAESHRKYIQRFRLRCREELASVV